MKQLIFLLMLYGPIVVSAQDDLMNMAAANENTQSVASTFKGIRIINGHSVETVGKHNLDFLIQHRFGPLSDGIKQFYGLDAATIRLGLEYGLTDRLMLGLGRGSFQKTVDALAKYRVLRQTDESGGMPVSLSVFTSYAIRTQQPISGDLSAADRSSFSGQVLLARKFGDALSLQLSPSLVYRQLPDEASDKQVVLATGLGGRYKLSKRTSFNAEWFYVLPKQINAIYTNSFSLGFDIETGGHVFQLGFSNAYGMTERQFMTETTGAWNKSNVHFGFNISRTFSFDRKSNPYEK